MHGGDGGGFQESISKNGCAHIGKRIFLGRPIDGRPLAADGSCRFARFAGLGRWRLGGWFAGLRIFLAVRTSTFRIGRCLFLLRCATTVLLGAAIFSRPEIATPARWQQQHEAGRQSQGSGQENPHAAIIRRVARGVKEGAGTENHTAIACDISKDVCSRSNRRHGRGPTGRRRCSRPAPAPGCPHPGSAVRGPCSGNAE